jgi:hypothetical protein
MTTNAPLLVWTPRLLGVIFAAFVGLFALDVFTEPSTVGQTLVAFVVHLLPAAIVLILLLIAWRWQAAGGLLFLAAGAGYAIAVVAGQRPLSWILAISGPLVLIGVLFLLSRRPPSRARGYNQA